ncbi:hypothetical protein WT92_16075 [Burkholderia stagnalis]|nr:hypothetical protein WT91_29480 [Burkholderia stagnalis]KWN96004.1 hypothetical protein WT92_16075 [Burkholderia stagnalis]
MSGRDQPLDKSADHFYVVGRQHGQPLDKGADYFQLIRAERFEPIRLRSAACYWAFAVGQPNGVDLIEHCKRNGKS